MDADHPAKGVSFARRITLARASLVHKQDALAKREVLEGALATITPQADKLMGYERKLAERIERFKTQKDVMKTTFAAARAQVRVSESLTGLDDRLGGTSDALRRTQEKVHSMRDRADALEGMVERGQLTDQSDPRSTTHRELDAIRAASAVDEELARLKDMAPKALEPPG